MRFEWDPTKNSANRWKHGFEFQEAVAVFDDPNHFEFEEVRYDHDEERWTAIGRVDLGSLTVTMVVYTDRGPDTRQIISARKTDSKYVREYYSRLDRS